LKDGSIIINEAQLILAEKRTSLASMRTGIAVLALPLTAVSFLIVTSRFYDATRVAHLFFPVVALCIVLALIGTYLIIRAVIKLHHYDRMMKKLKSKHSILSELLD
jgi:uncharacterized membrane protein YidH (DUF202 family)